MDFDEKGNNDDDDDGCSSIWADFPFLRIGNFDMIFYLQSTLVVWFDYFQIERRTHVSVM